MTREDVALYMRLSEGQLRHWICISSDNKCARCEGEGSSELVWVTIKNRDFVIPVCGDCIMSIKVRRYMLLRYRLSPEAYSNIENHLVVADQLCDECGQQESVWRMFSLGPEGYKSHYVCAQCSHRWNAQGEAAFPNIMATMHCSVVQ
jgi:DNA-directed RNA polymerase subunit M/transcription elongation factor TFIIS